MEDDSIDFSATSDISSIRGNNQPSGSINVTGLSESSEDDSDDFQPSEESNRISISSLHTDSGEVSNDPNSNKLGGKHFKKKDYPPSVSSEGINSSFILEGENISETIQNLGNQLKEVKTALKILNEKYKKLKIEFFAQKEKKDQYKQKLLKEKEKRKTQKAQNEKFIEKKKEEQKNQILMILNELNESLGRPLIQGNSQNLSSLTMSFGQAIETVKTKLKRLEHLERGEREAAIQNPPPPEPTPDNEHQAPREHQMETKEPKNDSFEDQNGENKLKLEVKIRQNFWQTDLIGEHWTFLAMKNKNNFLVGTHLKGLILVKNGEEVYADQLPEKKKRLWDVVYAEPKDCYFLCHNDKLYKKTNDGQPPTLHMNIGFGFRLGACMQYSAKNDRLLVNSSGRYITIIDTQEKNVELSIPKTFGSSITDFKLFGPDESYVACITMDGFLSIVSFDVSQAQGSVLTKFHISLKEKRKEEGLSLRLCDEGRYICVSLVSETRNIVGELGSLLNLLGQDPDSASRRGGIRPITSRFMVLEILPEGIIFKAEIDCFKQNIGRVHALGFLGNIGDSALFLALASEDGAVHVLDYDSKTEQLREKTGYRTPNLENDPVHVHKFGRELYYNGKRSNLVRLSIKEIEE